MEKILGGWKYFTNVLYMRYFLYILSLECLMVLGFFQLNMASILYLGFAVVVALASGVDAQSPRRCSSVSLIIQDNNPFLLPLPLYLFLTSFLVFFKVSQRYLSSRIQLCKRILWRYETTLKHTIKSYQYYSMTFFWK